LVVGLQVAVDLRLLYVCVCVCVCACLLHQQCGRAGGARGDTWS